MRLTAKVIVALLVGVTALIAGFAVAFANAGPHGNYERFTTDKCAGCHRPHTAAGAYLLRETSIFSLCTTCHGGGDGSTLNVLIGSNAWGRLNGGGFVTLGSGETLTAATSTHTVDGLGGSNGQWTAWGGASSGQGAVGTLECTSCHNPHGSTNYRILNDAQLGRYAGTPNAYRYRWDYDEGETIDQTDTLDWVDNQVLETADQPADGSRYGGNYFRTNYTTGMSEWCARCHKSYLVYGRGTMLPGQTLGTPYGPQTPSDYVQDPADPTSPPSPYKYGPNTQDIGDSKGDIARYRHTTSRSYVAYDAATGPAATARQHRFAAANPASTTRDGFVCTTCHFAHGTSAAATGFAANVAPTNDSALLVYPGRGVCRECHQTNK